MEKILLSVMEIMKEASSAENEKKYPDAMHLYSFALGHLAKAANKNEIDHLPLKEEVDNLIDECMVATLKLVKLQRGSNSEDDDDVHSVPVNSTFNFRPMKCSVNFNDICGMDDLKKDLELALILPIKHPQLFSDGREPYQSFLFFGPPGTGKTFLARAVAGQASCSNFFSIKASDVLSKYIGDSEKSVKGLFDSARRNKPSIIFIDEIDAICSKRTAEDLGKTRGMKTEILAQMEGVEENNKGIFIIGATNAPYDLDEALLRRFDKIFHIKLPNDQERCSLLKKMLADSGESFSKENFEQLVVKTKGFSNSDIKRACKDAKLKTIKRLHESTHFQTSKAAGTQVTVYTPCEPDKEGSVKINLKEIPRGQLSFVPQTTYNDVLECIQGTPVAEYLDAHKIEKFAKDRCEKFRGPDIPPPLEYSFGAIVTEIVHTIFG